MSTLTLSGWATPADAVAKAIAPDAATFDYSDYPSAEASFEGLRQFRDVEHIIGWSTGGQLALRAIADGVFRPARVTLIGVPFQFVQSADLKAAMDPFTFTTFRENYIEQPERTASRFQALVAKGDSLFKQVVGKLHLHHEVTETERWLPWLDELGTASLAGLDLSMIPQVTIIHGTADTVVPVAQSALLAKAIPNATLQQWEGVAHAPHLHDSARLMAALSAQRSAA